MTEESGKINQLSQEIIKSLESSSTDGISKYVSILLENESKPTTFDEYLNQLQQTLKSCTCKTSWNSDILLIKCLNCQKNSSSCVCAKCFLKGNHQGHKIIIFHGSCGCCDCGDPMCWSKSGFCSEHSGPESNPELTQLDSSTRIKLISISKSAFHYLQKFGSTNKQYFIHIIEFLTRLVSLGEAIRRCVCLSFCNSFDVIKFYTKSENFNSQDYEKIHGFFSILSSDDVFRTYFTITILNNFPKIIQICQQLSLNYTNLTNQPLISMGHFINLIFYAFTPSAVSQLVSESKIDWYRILNESLHLFYNYKPSQMTNLYFERSYRNSLFLRFVVLFKSVISNFDNKNSKVIEIIERFSEIISNLEFSYPITRALKEKIDDPDEQQLAIFDMLYKNQYLVHKISKKEIFTTKPLFLLKNFFDSLKFKSIDKSINDGRPFYFHSVLSQDVQISQLFTLNILAFTCLNLKEEKKLIDYISEVSDDPELFIKNWVIIPLRWVAAVILNDFNFFVRNSNDTTISMSSFKFKLNVKICFSPTFSLIQALLKSTKEIDNFYLMVISTFDLSVIENSETSFDDNEKRLILFSIFHFIASLIFDTYCTEKDLYMMLRFKVICELMTKNMSLEEIDSVCFKNVYYNDRFIEDFRTFTSKETTKNGTKFHLTDSSGWHPILPYLELSEIIPLIQKFIDKNPDSLVNFPSIQNGYEYLLFSPTLWCLIYCILDHKSCKDYQIIHQLIFNVLIEISKNSEKMVKKESQTVDEHSILTVNGFDKLIEKVKNLTFEQFMKQKINFNSNHDDVQGKSMIDLLSGSGNIGLAVLKRMNISDVDDNLSDESLQLKEQLKKKNKERANRIKHQMMSSFNQQQKTFQSSSSQFEDTIETEKVQKIECSICHIENDSDFFVYPAFIYKSSLSSYIKWRFSKAVLGDDSSTRIQINHTNAYEFDFIDYKTVHICLHPIHSKCIQDENYFCPTDRCLRNSALPIIDRIYDFKQISNKPLLSKIHNFIEEAYNDDLKFAVYSLASDIEVLEMRHRSNPNCLDNKTIEATLRNIYLCIWHSLHEKAEMVLIDEECKRRKKIIRNKIKNELNKTDLTDTWSQFKKLNPNSNLPDLDSKSSIENNVDTICSKFLRQPINNNDVLQNDINCSPLMKYILFSMISEESNILNMKEFIEGNLLPSSIQVNDSKLNHSEEDSLFKDTDVINDLSSDYQKLQFLRSAAIFDHFSRKKRITTTNNKELIDWDEVLSSSYLQHHYNIENSSNKIEGKGENLTLPAFSFVDVPNNYLDFILPPYSLPVDVLDEGEIALCLLTGKIVNLDGKSTNDYIFIKDLVDFVFGCSFSIFLVLNGSNASKVFISSSNPSCNIALKSFYVNKFNDIDIGINNKFLLFHSKTKEEEIIDNLLSGSWTSKIDKDFIDELMI